MGSAETFFGPVNITNNMLFHPFDTLKNQAVIRLDGGGGNQQHRTSKDTAAVCRDTEETKSKCNYNGEYSGQKCLCMPQPGNLRSRIYAPFFAVFREIREFCVFGNLPLVYYL